MSATPKLPSKDIPQNLEVAERTLIENLRTTCQPSVESIPRRVHKCSPAPHSLQLSQSLQMMFPNSNVSCLRRIGYYGQHAAIVTATQRQKQHDYKYLGIYE